MQCSRVWPRSCFWKRIDGGCRRRRCILSWWELTFTPQFLAPQYPPVAICTSWVLICGIPDENCLLCWVVAWSCARHWSIPWLGKGHRIAVLVWPLVVHYRQRFVVDPYCLPRPNRRPSAARHLVFGCCNVRLGWFDLSTTYLAARPTFLVVCQAIPAHLHVWPSRKA